MNHIRLSFFLCIAAVLCAPPVVSAQVYLIDASGRGWFAEDIGGNGVSPDNNYLAGNCGLGDCGRGEFRNWFEFGIPSLPRPIKSAELVLDSVIVLTLQDEPAMTFTVTSLPSVFGFSDLGTGTFYGSRSYSEADSNTAQSISLNAAALADIAANELGVFGVGGRVSDGAIFGGALLDQLVFGYSDTPNLTRLRITLVPELSGLTLAVLGFAGVVCRRRTRG